MIFPSAHLLSNTLFAMYSTMATVRPRAAPPMAHLVSFSPSILELISATSSSLRPGLSTEDTGDMVGYTDMVTGDDSSSLSQCCISDSGHDTSERVDKTENTGWFMASVVASRALSLVNVSQEAL